MTSPISGRVGSTGLPGSAEVDKLARDLNRMGPAQRKELRRRFDLLGSPILARARRNAGWSTRIPGAMVLQGITDRSKGRIGVQLRIRASQAPHARAYEGINSQGSAGYFRHPVFGDTDTWVSQETRPYAYPAVLAHADRARQACVDAFEAAARSCGFR